MSEAGRSKIQNHPTIDFPTTPANARTLREELPPLMTAAPIRRILVAALMNARMTNAWRPVTGAVVSVSKRLITIGAVALTVAFTAFAQSSDLQQKLAAVKQSMAENKQRLQTYQWYETTQLTLKDDPKPPTQSLCRYGPDGQVQKTAIGLPPEQPSGGRMKQKMIAKKKAEMKDYMQDVKTLLSMYVPPDPQRMQVAFQAGRLSLNPVPGGMNLIFTDYAQPKDKMTLTFDTGTKKITGLSINTYMGQEKDAVTLNVQMGSLPDGTNYVQQTVLNATAKKLVVTTTNSNYQKLTR